MRQFACLAFAFVVVVSGCTTPRFSPLPPGKFSGTVECVAITIATDGSQSTQTTTTNGTCEVNNRGILVNRDGAFAVGRTVQGEMGQATLTRIEATANGLVIHGTMSGIANVPFSGEFTAVYSTFEISNIQVKETFSATDSNGRSLNANCTSIRSPI